MTEKLQQFYDDVVLPIGASLTDDNGKVAGNIDDRLRYLAETILLELGDELPGKMIPVGEKLPTKETTDVGEGYLTRIELGAQIIVCECYWQDGRFTAPHYNGHDWTKRVTHWREMPSPQVYDQENEKSPDRKLTDLWEGMDGAL